MLFFFFSFLFFFLNQRIIVLKCCIDFCRTTMQISHTYTYIPCLLSLPPIHPHPATLGLHRACLTQLPVLYNSFLLAIYLTLDGVYMSIILSQFVTPCSSMLCLQDHPLMSASLLLPCKQIHQYHLARFHIYALIYNICFSYFILNSRLIHFTRSDSKPLLFYG